MFSKINQTRDGFTLIELMVVIAVLGILAGIGVPRLTGVVDQAREVEMQSYANNVRAGLEMYYTQNGEYPNSENTDSWGALRGAINTTGFEISGLPEIITHIAYNSEGNRYGGYLYSENIGTGYYFGDRGMTKYEFAESGNGPDPNDIMDNGGVNSEIGSIENVEIITFDSFDLQASEGQDEFDDSVVEWDTTTNDTR